MTSESGRISVLIAAMPAIGHVMPLTHVARALVESGCSVRFLAGAEFAHVIGATGAEFVALPPDADASSAGNRQDQAAVRRGSPLRRLRADFEAIFVAAIPAQISALLAAMTDVPADVLIADPLFLGAFALPQGDSVGTPIVFAYGVMPVLHSGEGVAPFGLGLRPGRGRFGRIRDRMLTRLIHGSLFAPVQRAAETAVRDAGGTAPRGFLLDWSHAADRYFQTGPRGLEYPRPGGDVRYEFVGAVPAPIAATDAPEWWPDTDRSIVFVTQGTVQNERLDALIEPTIAALADSGVFVVATTGSITERPVVGADHPYVTVVPYAPYEQVLPRIDLMITNGGFGGVQQALAYGVPLLVAGRTEDKGEVAARVAASGAGISLGTDTPTPRAIGRAARRVLRTASYREAAEQLAAESASCGLQVIVDAVAPAPSLRPAGDRRAVVDSGR